MSILSLELEMFKDNLNKLVKSKLSFHLLFIRIGCVVRWSCGHR
jgi:hypothetical protein